MPHQDSKRELLELSLSLQNISSLLEDVVHDSLSNGSDAVVHSINTAIGYTQFVSERLLEIGLENAQPLSASHTSRALLTSAAV